MKIAMTTMTRIAMYREYGVDGRIVTVTVVLPPDPNGFTALTWIWTFDVLRSGTFQSTDVAPWAPASNVVVVPRTVTLTQTLRYPGMNTGSAMVQRIVKTWPPWTFWPAVGVVIVTLGELEAGSPGSLARWY